MAQGTSIVGFSYDNLNRRSTLTLSNGVNVSYAYDNNSRVTGITYKFNANTLGDLEYTYDSLGRRTLINGSFAQTALPGAMSSGTYDAANELTNWNGTAFSYDLNGNMLSDGANAFTWNARNQVASLNSLSLQYDAFGRRIQNAAGKSFLYDGANASQELYGSTVLANLLSGGIDETFSRTDSSGTYTPLQDALGSTIALVDSSGNVVTTYAYDPFGKTTVSGVSNSNAFQYTGRENEGTGLYFYRERYVETVYGRFISEDPLGLSGGDINLYAYVGQNPANFTDPSGLSRNCFSLFGNCGGNASGPPPSLAGRKALEKLTWGWDFTKSFFDDFTIDTSPGSCISVLSEAYSPIMDTASEINEKVLEPAEEEARVLPALGTSVANMFYSTIQWGADRRNALEIGGAVYTAATYLSVQGERAIAAASEAFNTPEGMLVLGDAALAWGVGHEAVSAYRGECH